MELSEIILRALYLVVLYVFLNILLRMTTQLSGNALIMVSFFGAVLLLYVTFDSVYDFLLNNELILKVSGKDDADENDDDGKGSSGTTPSKITKNVTNQLNISNKRNVEDNNILNHTHKYVENKVFE